MFLKGGIDTKGTNYHKNKFTTRGRGELQSFFPINRGRDAESHRVGKQM